MKMPIQKADKQKKGKKGKNTTAKIVDKFHKDEEPKQSKQMKKAVDVEEYTDILSPVKSKKKKRKSSQIEPDFEIVTPINEQRKKHKKKTITSSEVDKFLEDKEPKLSDQMENVIDVDEDTDFASPVKSKKKKRKSSQIEPDMEIMTPISSQQRKKQRVFSEPEDSVQECEPSPKKSNQFSQLDKVEDSPFLALKRKRESLNMTKAEVSFLGSPKKTENTKSLNVLTPDFQKKPKKRISFCPETMTLEGVAKQKSESPKKLAMEIKEADSAASNSDTSLENIKDSSEDADSWTIEDQQSFLRKVTAFVDKENDGSIVRELRNFNWEKFVASSSSFTGEHLEEKLREMLRGIHKTRNLYEMLTAAGRQLERNKSKQIKKETRKDRPLTAFAIFLKENTVIVKNLYLTKNPNKLNFMTFAHQCYNQLDAEKQKVYIDMSASGKMAIEPKSAVTPFHFLCAAAGYTGERGKADQLKELKAKFSALSDKKRLKYIRKSVECLQGLLTDSDINEAKLVGKLTKAEISLYLSHADVPAIPAKDGRRMYAEEISETEKRGLTFNELSENKRKQYNDTAKENFKIFQESFQNWYKSQNKFTQLLADKHYEKIIKRFNSKDTMKDVYMTSVYMPIAGHNIKFDPAPPMSNKCTYVSVFQEELAASGESTENAVEKYRKLSAEEKRRLKMKAVDKKNEAIQLQLDYVRQLGKEQVGLYLGLKRMFFFRKFGQDIFAQEFPHERYPVYVKKNEVMVANNSVQNDMEKSIHSFDMENRVNANSSVMQLQDSSDDEEKEKSTTNEDDSSD